MKLKISAKKGELEQRGEDLIKAVKKLIKKKTGITEENTTLDLKALEEGKKKGIKEVERIRQIALKKIFEVIG